MEQASSFDRIRRVPLDAVVTDGGTKVREFHDAAVIADYAELMAAGEQFPPVAVFHDGAGYLLADGFYRVLAARSAGALEIDADVRQGGLSDALWFALGANRAHGARLSEGDKARAVLLALRAWPDKSAHLISEQIGVNHVYVTRIRGQVMEELNLPAVVEGQDGKLYPAKRDTPAVVESRRAEQRARVVAMVRDGKSSKEIVATLRVRNSLIADVRRELGVGALDKTKAGVEQRRKRVREMAGRGFTRSQIAAELGVSQENVADIAKKAGYVIQADTVVGKTHRHDSNRIVAQTVLDAENLTAGLDLIDYAQLDPAQVPVWLASLHAARRALSAFIRRLEQEQKQHGEAVGQADADRVQDQAG
jgi:ParB-like chromosome segregation protein Spo0J